MGYRLYLTVRPTPSAEDVPRLRQALQVALPSQDTLPYLQALEGREGHPVPPSLLAQRLGALSLLPALLTQAGVDRETVCLRRNAEGRPYAVSPEGAPLPLDFNLSHSSGHTAAALLVGEGRVGVDIEELVPPQRVPALLRRFGTEGELTRLNAVPRDELQVAHFFTSLWVGREALAKQDGGGFPLRFDTHRLPLGVVLWNGTLPETQTAIALCAPLSSPPVPPCLLPDSLLVSFEKPPRSVD